jgi:hypothetical protein
MTGYPVDHELLLPERTTPASTVRETVRGLFARLRAPADPGGRDRDEPDGPPVAAWVSPARALRERAHLAYATVQVAGTNAVDVALDVVIAEATALDERAHRQAEALKAIRLYAPTPWVRRIAEQGLAASGTPAASWFLRPADGNEAEEAEIWVSAARWIG